MQFGGEEEKKRRVTCVLFLDLLFMVSRRLLGTSHGFCVWSVSYDYDLKARKEKGLVREAQHTARFAHVRPGPQAVQAWLKEPEEGQSKGPTELGHRESLPSVARPGSASPGLRPVWTGTAFRQNLPFSTPKERGPTWNLAGSVLLRNPVDQVMVQNNCEAQPFTPNMTSGNGSGLSG